MTDIVERLQRYDAGPLAAERLMRDACGSIQSLQAKLARYEADDIHSCGEACQRPLCVLRADNEALREGLALAVVELAKSDRRNCKSIGKFRDLLERTKP